MLYSEFIEGTKCRDNEHNYGVYKDIEAMYMNTDMSKEKAYEYGKKLVDNSKTEKEIEQENEIKEEIARIRENIKWNKDSIEDYKALVEAEKRADNEEYWLKTWRNRIKMYQEENKLLRQRIKELNFILGK